MLVYTAKTEKKKVNAGVGGLVAELAYLKGGVCMNKPHAKFLNWFLIIVILECDCSKRRKNKSNS